MVSEAEIRRRVGQVVDELGGSPPPAPRVDATPAAERRGTVACGADHGGYALKEKLVSHLRTRGFEVRDCGTHSAEPVDYPDFAHAVAQQVAAGTCIAGIVVDGAGIGSCMVANKVPGVRAAACWDISSARNSREHNHANVLTLGAGLLGEALARQIVDEWLATAWGPDRHARRVAKIAAVERRYSALPAAAEASR
jgi:ribose 5-phosphate isomerase B